MAYSYLNFGNNIVPQSINDTGEVAGYVLGNRFSETLRLVILIVRGLLI